MKFWNLYNGNMLILLNRNLEFAKWKYANGLQNRF